MSPVAGTALLLSLVGAEPEVPEELGQVQFGRDLAAAKLLAQKTGRPIFLLFTEVPGCQTVRGFAKDALSNPVIIEAAAAHFAPVAIYNNHPGPDREVLESFREPAWNNPVVRFLAADGKELTPRHAGDYSGRGLAKRMMDALEAADRPVPESLRRLAGGQLGREATIVFGMYCFWSGEAAIGGLEGVVKTRAGFLDGHEVVEAVIDTSKVSAADVLAEVKRQKAADSVWVHDPALRTEAARIFGDRVHDLEQSVRVSDKDTKYYLRQSKVDFTGMSETEASRMNARVAGKASGR